MSHQSYLASPVKNKYKQIHNSHKNALALKFLPQLLAERYCKLNRNVYSADVNLIENMHEVRSLCGQKVKVNGARSLNT